MGRGVVFFQNSNTNFETPNAINVGMVQSFVSITRDMNMCPVWLLRNVGTEKETTNLNICFTSWVMNFLALFIICFNELMGLSFCKIQIQTCNPDCIK